MADRWEYKSIILKFGVFSKIDKQNRQIEEQLNQHGAVGWELVNYMAIGAKYRAILKRKR